MHQQIGNECLRCSGSNRSMLTWADCSLSLSGRYKTLWAEGLAPERMCRDKWQLPPAPPGVVRTPRSSLPRNQASGGFALMTYVSMHRDAESADWSVRGKPHTVAYRWSRRTTGRREM